MICRATAQYDGRLIPYLAFLGLVVLERMAELRRSRRNVEWAIEQGGVEVGQRHFRVMTLVHSLFLPACILEVWLLGRPFIPALGIPMLVLALLAQFLRYWAVRTLGPRWNVRTVFLPGRPVVTGGPYRFVRHPNYVAVIVEMFAIPLVHTAWLTALVFTLLNVPLLIARIRCEEAALAEHSEYGRLDSVPRFLPRFPRLPGLR